MGIDGGKLGSINVFTEDTFYVLYHSVVLQWSGRYKFPTPNFSVFIKNDFTLPCGNERVVDKSGLPFVQHKLVP